nr:MerR family transcriptional regulator [Amycolatopsis lexingtonensis]
MDVRFNVLCGRSRQEDRVRIGELAEKTGVSVRSLRYYEEKGMLVPERTAGGHRSYPEAGVGQVWLIQQFYAAGLSSTTIQGIMPAVRAGRANPEVIELLITERDRIDRLARELVDARQKLDTIIATASSDSCRHDAPDDPKVTGPRRPRPRLRPESPGRTGSRRRSAPPGASP